MLIHSSDLELCLVLSCLAFARFALNSTVLLTQDHEKALGRATNVSNLLWYLEEAALHLRAMETHLRLHCQ